MDCVVGSTTNFGSTLLWLPCITVSNLLYHVLIYLLLYLEACYTAANTNLIVFVADIRMTLKHSCLWKQISTRYAYQCLPKLS